MERCWNAQHRDCAAFFLLKQADDLRTTINQSTGANNTRIGANLQHFYFTWAKKGDQCDHSYDRSSRRLFECRGTRRMQYEQRHNNQPAHFLRVPLVTRYSSSKGLPVDKSTGSVYGRGMAASYRKRCFFNSHFLQTYALAIRSWKL